MDTAIPTSSGIGNAKRATVCSTLYHLESQPPFLSPRVVDGYIQARSGKNTCPHAGPNIFCQSLTLLVSGTG